LFGTTAWDVLEEENREQPQVFGSAFPRPPSGQQDAPTPMVAPSLEDFVAELQALPGNENLTEQQLTDEYYRTFPSQVPLE